MKSEWRKLQTQPTVSTGKVWTTVIIKCKERGVHGQQQGALLGWSFRCDTLCEIGLKRQAGGLWEVHTKCSGPRSHRGLASRRVDRVHIGARNKNGIYAKQHSALWSCVQIIPTPPLHILHPPTHTRVPPLCSTNSICHTAENRSFSTLISGCNCKILLKLAEQKQQDSVRNSRSGLLSTEALL